MSSREGIYQASVKQKRGQDLTADREQDHAFMRLALRLAAKGLGRTSPNPAVGALIVQSGELVGRGFHRRAGEPHAEVEALEEAGEAARGSTLYVNLEPCSHYGRTPPCAEALIRAGVRRVVVGMVDPNPLVQGKGIECLERAGIEVTVGVLREACERLNEDFSSLMRRGRPLVTLKLAASLDGKIAAASGDSHWISGEASRRWVHRLRNQVDAVLVGAGTVEKDNPRLTCRIRGGRDPLRVILDGRLRISPEARVLVQPSEARTLVVTAVRRSSPKVRLLEGRGAEVLCLPGHEGEVAFLEVLQELGKRGIKSVLIEGGARVAASALRAGAVDKVLFFYAPKLLGGDGKEMVGSLGIRQVAQALAVHKIEVRRFGEDVVIGGYIKKEESS